MAPKRPNPLENPPDPSSSEDEDDDASSEEETDQDEKKEGLASDEEEDEEEDDDDEDSPVKKPETAAPVAVESTNHKPEASESEAESGSQSESESESEPERTKHESVKPLATKPMLESAGSKKPGMAVVGLPAISAAKRPSTELGKDGKDSKRVKKAEEDEGKKTGDDTKKQLFQRLFSEDDEIALLQGILEFTATKGDPHDHMDEFCEFVKKSINFNASKAQLSDKIRRLRRKFENSVNKSVSKGKNGEDRVYSKAHDQKSFDLWKKIWGSDGALHSTPKSAKSKKNQGGNSKALAFAGNDVFASPMRGEAKREGDKEGASDFQIGRCKNVGISGREMASLLKVGNATGFDEFVVMQGWDMADEQKKREVEEKWKKIRAAQMELLLQRNEFIGEATRLIFEALKANSPDFGH